MIGGISAINPAAKLPEDDLVFFLIDTVPLLDLSTIYAPYENETRASHQAADRASEHASRRAEIRNYVTQPPAQ